MLYPVLKDLVADMNEWNEIFGKKAMSFPLTQEDVTAIAHKIDADMSPENLYRDGEASVIDVNRKRDWLTVAHNELRDYAVRNDLVLPKMYEI